MMERLSGATQLLYSELLQQGLRGLPLDKGISFVQKKINNKIYWYLQVVIGSRQSQYSIGPDSPGLRKLIQKEKDLKEQEKDVIDSRKELVAMLSNGGGITANSEEGAVLSLLERCGVFLTGAALIGSHAFGVYSNMLGVKWSSRLYMTDDIDICENTPIYIGIKPVAIDLRSAIINANMGFFEVPALNRKHPSTSFKIRSKRLEIDILTPMYGKESSTPVYIPSLKTYAEPVRYLDYLLKDVQPAVLVFGRGIFVNVPSPAYYALHKLVVSCLRPVAYQTKALKDISQASQLIEVLMTDRTGDIEIALQDAQSMPKKFIKLLHLGIGKLPENLKQEFRKLES